MYSGCRTLNGWESWPVIPVKSRIRSTDSRTSSVSSRLSNCRRKAPVATGVVRAAGADIASRTTGDIPTRVAENAVEQPTIPAPMIMNSAPAGRAVSTLHTIATKLVRAISKTKR